VKLWLLRWSRNPSILWNLKVCDHHHKTSPLVPFLNHFPIPRMEAPHCSKTSVHFWQTKWQHILEDSMKPVSYLSFIKIYNTSHVRKILGVQYNYRHSSSWIECHHLYLLIKGKVLRQVYKFDSWPSAELWSQEHSLRAKETTADPITYIHCL
jgi:hypothetical protein